MKQQDDDGCQIFNNSEKHNKSGRPGTIYFARSKLLQESLELIYQHEEQHLLHASMNGESETKCTCTWQPAWLKQCKPAGRETIKYHGQLQDIAYLIKMMMVLIIDT